MDNMKAAIAAPLLLVCAPAAETSTDYDPWRVEGYCSDKDGCPATRVNGKRIPVCPPSATKVFEGLCWDAKRKTLVYHTYANGWKTGCIDADGNYTTHEYEWERLTGKCHQPHSAD